MRSVYATKRVMYTNETNVAENRQTPWPTPYYIHTCKYIILYSITYGYLLDNSPIVKLQRRTLQAAAYTPNDYYITMYVDIRIEQENTVLHLVG